MKVSELIVALKKLPQDLPFLVDNCEDLTDCSKEIDMVAHIVHGCSVTEPYVSLMYGEN